MKYHSVIIHSRPPTGSYERREIEPYECKIIDGHEFLYGFDITKIDYTTIPMSSIIEVYDSGNTFKPNPAKPEPDC